MSARLSAGLLVGLAIVSSVWFMASLGQSQAPLPPVPRPAPPGPTPAPAAPTAADVGVPLPALGDPAFAGIAEPIGFTPVKGSNLPVRDGNEDQFTAQTKTVPVEVYRDEDFQTLIYVSQSGSVAAVPYRRNFELRTLSNEGAFSVVRFSPTTGIAWQLNELTWKPIEETGDIPIGDYDVQYMPSKEGFTVLRLDRYSGQVWYLNAEDKWQLTAETPLAAGDEAPATGTTPATPTNPTRPPLPPRPN